MKAVGYIRVSTVDQAREGWSLGAQRERIGAYCKSRGWELVEVFADEGVSGKNGVHRPAFEAMISHVLGDGIEVIVALKLDRLGRSAKGLLDVYDRLERKGVAIVTVDDSIDTSTAHGRFFRTILAGVAEFERDMIAARTRNGVAAARAAGKRVGGVPYGWKMSKPKGEKGKKGTLIEDPAEQAVIARIRELRESGLGVNRIAESLNSEGVPTRGGGRWHPTQVWRIVRASDK